MIRYGFGIDIGGTKISMVLGTDQGKILCSRTTPTLKNKQIPRCIKRMTEALCDLMKESKIPRQKIVGIGIGIPGAVNPKKGVVPSSPNLQGWKNYPLRHVLERKFGLPVRMVNDGNAAVMAEKIFGQGCGKKHILYLTISTGVGSGIIVNDELVEGADFVGGEVGHMVIVPHGHRCNCGQHGCLEAYTSGTAIARYVEREIRHGNSSGKKLTRDNRKISALEIGKAATQGNPLAIRAFRDAGFYLGVGIGSLLNILNPEIVILGGGVLKTSPKVFWQSMLRSVRMHSWPKAFRSTKIVRTKLGDNVGNLGALSLAFTDQMTEDRSQKIEGRDFYF